MLSNSLNTNEIKNAAGTEEEFQSIDVGPGRTRIFAKIGEIYSRQHRLKIQHLETGSGLKLRRRSNFRFDKTVISDVDLVTPASIMFGVTIDIPVGLLVATTEVDNVCANGMSFLSSDGTSTTILFSGAGNGAKALREGSL